MIRNLFVILVAWTLATGFCNAEIAVSLIVIDLKDGVEDAPIAVKNLDSQHKAYVEITPFLVTHPNTPQEKKTRVINPQQQGLLVFPAKIVLLPGQTQFVRVLKTKKINDTETVYEVTIVPKESTLFEQKEKNGAVIGIHVVIGYGARVTIRPQKLKPAVLIKRVANELVIKNTGNTQLRIASCFFELEGKKHAVALPMNTLFAGSTIKAPVPAQKIHTELVLMDELFGSFDTN